MEKTKNFNFDYTILYILYDALEWFVKRFCHNCRAYKSVSDGFESDHKLVAMSCHFPSKKARKEIFQKKIPSPHCDIKVLKCDSGVADRFSI